MPAMPWIQCVNERTDDWEPVKLHLLVSDMYSTKALDMLFKAGDWEKYLHMRVFERTDIGLEEGHLADFERGADLVSVGEMSLWEHILLFQDTFYNNIEARKSPDTNDVAPHLVRNCGAAVWYGAMLDKMINAHRGGMAVED